MKKIMMALVGLLLCACLVACGNNGQTEQGGDADVTPTAAIQTEQPSAAPKEKGDELDLDAKVVEKSIYINFSGNRRREDGMASLIFQNSSGFVIALAYDDSTFSGTSHEALDLLNDGRTFKDIIRYSNADFRVSMGNTFAIDFASVTSAKVNGMETQQFRGTVTDNNGRQCFVYGYAFVIDNTACALIGTDSNKEQDPEKQKAMIDEVDRMMATVRTER